jgi:hypothetical protein
VSRELERIHAQGDAHAARDLPPAAGLDKLPGGPRHDDEAVVAEPVDQRPDAGELLILKEHRVVMGSQQVSPLFEQAAQALEVDIEAERPAAGMKVEAVDEQRQAVRCRENVGHGRLSKSLYRKQRAVEKKLRRSAVYIGGAGPACEGAPIICDVETRCGARAAGARWRGAI